MADTPRTVAALQALFANNTSGDISPQDLRDFLVSALGECGGIYIDEGVTSLTGISATPKKNTLFNTAQGYNGVQKGNVTVDKANSKITVGTTGTYRIFHGLSFVGSLNKTFHFEVYKNGSPLDNVSLRTEVQTTTVQAAAASGIVDLVVGDVLEVYVDSPDGGTSITVQEEQLNVDRVV